MTSLEAQTSPAALTASNGCRRVSHYGLIRSFSNAIRGTRYKIRTLFLLSFPLSPELNQTVTVQPDGYLICRPPGSLHIQGMTVPEVVDALKKAYAGILNEPIINVDLEDYQKPFFIVSGQVGKPGQYDLRADITVAEASPLLEDSRPRPRPRSCSFIALRRIGSKSRS